MKIQSSFHSCIRLTKFGEGSVSQAGVCPWAGGGVDRPHASVPLPPGHGTWIPYPLPHHSGGHHWRLVQTCLVNLRTYPGADPRFPIGGGANPPGGRQHKILPKFLKNCMKLRKCWAGGRFCLRSATATRPYLHGTDT